MKVPAIPSKDWLAARVRHLDAASYRDREKATADLAAAGELAADALREAKKSASPEAQQRIAGLLPKVDAMTPEVLLRDPGVRNPRGNRHRGGASALAEWAKSAPGSTLGREAAESLERLRGRPK